MSDNPFAGPFGRSGPFADKSDGNPNSTLPCCPVCKTRDWDVINKPMETVKKCRACGNEWSGGSMNIAQPDLRFPAPPDGVPVDDSDLFVPQNDAPDFRNPNKNYGWNE